VVLSQLPKKLLEVLRYVKRLTSAKNNLNFLARLPAAGKSVVCFNLFVSRTGIIVHVVN